MLTLSSCAKLNLYLEVVNKRPDGYHNLKTLFERIDLADTIQLKLRADSKITLRCNNPLLPCDQSNLALRSAVLLQKTFSVNKGADIVLKKRIPIGAGLGGGSSNAAAVLLGLNKLWRLNLSRKKLLQLGKRLGSDVPFFLYGTPFALATARGDKIKPLAALNRVRLWHIVVVPDLHVSTPLIYSKWDTFSGLTKPSVNVKLILSALLKDRFSCRNELFYNSLEEVTAKLYPEVAQAKEKLARHGLKAVLMSGSGSSVFAIVSSRKEAITLRQQLRVSKRWRVFVAQTV